MLKLVLLVFSIIFIFPSDCRIQSTVVKNPSLCINNSYIMPLFSTQFLRITLNRTRLKQLNIHTVRLRATIADKKIVEFEDHRGMIKRIFYIRNDTEKYNGGSTIIYNLKIQANYIDRTFIHYSIETTNIKNEINRMNCSIVVMVSQPQRFRDKAFKGTIPYIIVFISIQMGILLDTHVLKEMIRRPIQITIGFVCQYIIMPLIAFAISKIFQYPRLYGLGLFVVGCCPGGSASNQWTVIFDGDINLSVFMSFASTVASFIMMPVWLYTLGQYAYLRELHIRIPFFNLAISLLTIIGPIGIGMLLVHFIPKLKAIVNRFVKPMLLLLMVYFFIFGAFANYYLFSYIDLKTALTAPLLPWIGFLAGGLIAWICQQDSKRIITIGIETGIQNVGIAFMVLLYSFPAPDNAKAAVIPLIVAYLSVQPFYIILACRFIRQKCCPPKEPDPRISVDTLSKTTRQLSDAEEAEPLDHPPKRKVSLAISVLGLSTDPKPLEI